MKRLMLDDICRGMGRYQPPAPSFYAPFCSRRLEGALSGAPGYFHRALQKQAFPQAVEKLAPGLRRESQNLYLLAPPPVLPFGNKYRFINKFNQGLIAGTVKRACRSLGYTGMDVYSFLPWAVDLLPHIKYDRVIYDCVDDHTAFSASSMPGWFIRWSGS